MTRALLVIGLIAAVVIVALWVRTSSADWSVKLTTVGRTSGRPRTVTIWYVRDGDRIYVQAGQDGKTDWYRNLLKTPDVTLALEGRQVHGRARPVDDAAESARIHELFMQKYWTARIAHWLGRGFGTGKVVEVVPQLGRSEG